MRKGVARLDVQVRGLKADVSDIKEDVSSLEGDVSKMSDKQDKIYGLVLMDVARLKEAVFGR